MITKLAIDIRRSNTGTDNTQFPATPGLGKVQSWFSIPEVQPKRIPGKLLSVLGAGALSLGIDPDYYASKGTDILDRYSSEGGYRFGSKYKYADNPSGSIVMGIFNRLGPDRTQQESRRKIMEYFGSDTGTKDYSYNVVDGFKDHKFGAHYDPSRKGIYGAKDIAAFAHEYGHATSPIRKHIGSGILDTAYGANYFAHANKYRRPLASMLAASLAYDKVHKIPHSVLSQVLGTVTALQMMADVGVLAEEGQASTRALKAIEKTQGKEVAAIAREALKGAYLTYLSDMLAGLKGAAVGAGTGAAVGMAEKGLINLLKAARNIR